MIYRLAGIIANNFRVKNYYYYSSADIELHYVGLLTDVIDSFKPKNKKEKNSN
ncbi:hypothetical protein N5D_18230 [Enterococcus faecalis]|nr:hypothetical protein L6D_16640 [Enterococcus faecalis]BDX51093.1 hypothetical protein N4E_25960 [Enterococcus faecalis]GMC17846.1 hypothetical protein N5D_18230 [Enterococcus faecalis]